VVRVKNLRFFEIALMLVRLNRVASFIVNANRDWIIGRFRFRTVRSVWFRQGKNLSKNLREPLCFLRWDTHHIADVADLKFCLLLRSFFLKTEVRAKPLRKLLKR
jgi:hypothetical protein